LHERLQALVNESNSWRNNSTSQHASSTSASSSTTTTNLQQKSSSTLANKKEIVIRGGGHSTKTNADEPSEVLFQGGQPLTPAQGLKEGGAYLTDYEKLEMQKYPAIYFMGQPNCKRRRRGQSDDSNKKEWNDGYDDDRGDYHIVERDHLAYRYEVLGTLGKGSFGQVLKCFDHRGGHTVAIKLIRNKKRFHTQAVVEINILKQLVAWDPDDEHHNVRMRDHFSFRNHLCLVFECLSINLYDYIKNNHFQGSSMGLIKR
jgi:dual specificity tyrosine-phosphorylation-regulated kinase 2/3/4